MADTVTVERDNQPSNAAPRGWARALSARGWAFAAVYLIWGSTYLAIRIGVGSIPQVTPASWAALAYLTLLGSLVAFSAFNWLVTRTTPSQLSTTAYVNPVVAVVLGWVVLGETLHPVSLAGAAFILAAVVIMLVPPAIDASRLRRPPLRP